MVCMCFFNFEFLICYYSVSRSNYALFPSSNEVLCISKCRIRVFSCSRSNCVILYYYIGVSKEGFLQKSEILGNDNTGTITRI
jgi:hypothetical protein